MAIEVIEFLEMCDAGVELELMWYEAAERANKVAGPCNDDYEAECPLIGMLPEESDGEHGSPLNFSKRIEPKNARPAYPWF